MWQIGFGGLFSVIVLSKSLLIGEKVVENTKND